MRLVSFEGRAAGQPFSAQPHRVRTAGLPKLFFSQKLVGAQRVVRPSRTCIFTPMRLPLRQFFPLDVLFGQVFCLQMSLSYSEILKSGGFSGRPVGRPNPFFSPVWTPLISSSLKNFYDRPVPRFFRLTPPLFPSHFFVSLVKTWSPFFDPVPFDPLFLGTTLMFVVQEFPFFLPHKNPSTFPDRSHLVRIPPPKRPFRIVN